MKVIVIYISIVIFVFTSCSNSFDGKNGIKTVMFPGKDQVCQTIEYRDGKKNGALKEYYENGNLKTVQFFKNDKNVDSALYYHSNGKLAAIQVHNNGEKVGCWKKFNDAGKLYSQICFENDRLNGTSLTYSYKSLNLIECYNFKDGYKNGKQETFYNSGKPKSVEIYINDRLCIGTKEWLENGELVNNDFAIKYVEQNKVNLENKLYYFISLQNLNIDDEVFRISEKDTGNIVTQIQRLERRGNNFVLEFSIYPGGFIMEKVKLAAYRKTKLGNTLIKTISFNASANHF
jgi:antitoxin component YwqK of YwqJK toxin-antitoxin module